MIENGFKEEEKRALTDYKSNDNEYAKKLAFLAYKSNVYQVRMYSVFLFGYLSEQNDVLAFMRDEVSKDDNWRVQEVLAKAFDEFCKKIGYEKALPIIDEWLKNNNPNTRRAVTEGLRIWTSRPYFKDNPNEAIRRIAALKEDTNPNMAYSEEIEGYYMEDMPRIPIKTLVTMYQTYMGEYRLKYSITESKAQVLYIYGEKEMGCVKESAKLFQKMHPNCTVYEAKGYNHGYLSAYLPLEWMDLVNPFLENDVHHNN